MSYASHFDSKKGDGKPRAPAPAPAGPSGGSAAQLLDTRQEPRSRNGRTEGELLQSTMKSLAEATEISTRTLGTLNQQTEQIERIKADAEAIDSNLDQSEYLLRSLKKWGWVKTMFSRDPGSKQKHIGCRDAPAVAPGPAEKGAPAAGKAAGSAPKAPEVPESRGAARLSEAQAMRKGTSASTQRGVGAEKAQSQNDKAYDDIEKMLVGLKEQSKEMGRTIKTHNEILPEVAESVNKDQDRLRQQQKTMRELMGR